jgi:hypothetical protein
VKTYYTCFLSYVHIHKHSPSGVHKIKNNATQILYYTNKIPAGSLPHMLSASLMLDLYCRHVCNFEGIKIVLCETFSYEYGQISTLSFLAALDIRLLALL